MITTSVGRIFHNKPRSPKHDAFTIIELLVVVSLISVITITSLKIIERYVYYYKTQITLTKIKALIIQARTTALITNKSISICAYNKTLKYCDVDWHHPIIIFYHTENKETFSQSQIILFEQLNLSPIETISFAQFKKNHILTFNQYGDLPQNGSIIYTNNYNKAILNINKQGLIKDKLETLPNF